MRYIPFAVLEIADGVWEDKAMTRANRFNNTAGYIVLSAAGVCLVHGVELGATTLNLESIRLGDLKGKIHVRLSRGGSFQHGGYTASSQRNMTIQTQVLDPRLDDSSA